MHALIFRKKKLVSVKGIRMYQCVIFLYHSVWMATREMAHATATCNILELHVNSAVIRINLAQIVIKVRKIQAQYKTCCSAHQFHHEDNYEGYVQFCTSKSIFNIFFFFTVLWSYSI